MLQNRATLKETRFYLLDELRHRYPEQESQSIARLILEHTGVPLSACLLEPDKITPSSAIAQINLIVGSVHEGKPIQYILGHTEFCELKITVNESVLIPRPETEAMVYRIISHKKQGYRRIIDLGTGSGCIALALKQHIPEARVTGIDFNIKALELARRNALENDLDVLWLEGDLLHTSSLSKHPAVKEGFDLVVSNPPYVLVSEKKLMEEQILAFEPGDALFVKDEDPLLFYHAILDFCNLHLLDGGYLWLEINERFGTETARLFEVAEYQSVRIIEDIHGKERYIHARK